VLDGTGSGGAISKHWRGAAWGEGVEVKSSWPL